MDIENNIAPDCLFFDGPCRGMDTVLSQQESNTHTLMDKYYQPYTLHYDLSYFNTGIMTKLHEFFYVMSNQI